MTETTTSRAWIGLLVAAAVAVLMVPAAALAGVALDSGDAQPAGPEPGTRLARCPDQADLGPVVDDRGSEYIAGTRVSLDAGDSFFDPTCALDVSGGPVQLVVDNNGTLLHNVTIVALGIDQDVAPGETLTLDVDLRAGGRLAFYCKFHRTTGMVGSLLAG